jgi:hypothetical protein
MILLSTNEILELGETLYNKVMKLNIPSSELIIEVDDLSFKR